MAKNNSTPKTIQLPLILEGATVSIYLDKGFVTMVDAIDADLLQYHWHVNHNLYACRATILNGIRKEIRLHRVILERKLGRPLFQNENCDHIDTDPLNNRRENLRPATKAQNNRNMGKTKRNKSGYKGVSFRYGKWQARISVDNKTINLGWFNSPEEAHEAYKRGAIKYHGEFARFE